jgi:hypothetical protein
LRLKFALPSAHNPKLDVCNTSPGKHAISGGPSTGRGAKIYYIDDLLKEFNRPYPYIIYIFVYVLPTYYRGAKLSPKENEK